MADAKCARLRIIMSGDVSGSVEADDQVAIEVSPDPNSKQDPVPIKNHRFDVRVLFDPTRSGGRFGHDCSRSPTTVWVSVVRGERTLVKRELAIGREFRQDEDGNYVLKADLVLDVKP